MLKSNFIRVMLHRLADSAANNAFLQIDRFNVFLARERDILSLLWIDVKTKSRDGRMQGWRKKLNSSSWFEHF
jgi:hypothetical protein